MTSSQIELAPHTHRVTLLLAVAGLLVAGYALWRVDHTADQQNTLRDRVQAAETANAALRSELATLNADSKKAQADLNKQWQQLTSLPQQVKDIAAANDDLRARTEKPQRAWSRAEALYLIELAQRRLSFDHDTATAIVAIESADARLASLRDPTLNKVRERIAKDLQALRAVPDPDRTGVMARLLAVDAQAQSMPLKGLLVGQRLSEIATDNSSSLQRTWTSIAGAFSRMISVRRIDDGNGSVVTLEEQTLRRQHLSLLVFAARHAMLRNDQPAYLAALDAAHSWTAQYFGETPAATAVLDELMSLARIDIAPALPDISTAAKLLAGSTSGNAGGSAP